MSQAPMRLAAGFTQQRVFQPFGLMGVPDPLWYIQNFDDFTHWVAGRYTLTNTGNGTIAGADGDGGRVLFTTNSTTPAGTDISSLQSANAYLAMDSTKKFGCMARFQLADVTNPAVNVGLIQKTATPFTVVNGIYLNKPSASTVFTLNVVSASTVQASFAIPAASFTPVNATDFDIGFQYDGRSQLLIYAGTGLMGSQPDQDRANLGLVGRLDLSSLTLAATALCMTLAIQSGTASSKTMNADFLTAAKER